ncbi:MAG: hypothetical protein ABIJ09_25595 [Pseudomonadota bacterium]
MESGKVNDRSLKPLIGIWMVSRSSVRSAQKLGRELGDEFAIPAAFLYDGEHITTRLEHEADWMWRSVDGFYRLECRWDGEEIHLRTPFDGWKYFVTMKDDVFHRYENSVDWCFERGRPSTRSAEFQSLEMERARHDYSINSVGEVDPGWQDDMDGG